MHSTSSQSSSISRPRTKAAMKGYENLKVSIPTTGLDLQHALDRSPNVNGCKLAALADIALGNDVPVGLVRPKYSSTEKLNTHLPKTPSTSIARGATKQNTSIIIVADSSKIPQNDGKNKIFDASISSLQKTNKKRSQQNTGNKLGFKERKKKSRVNGKNSAKSKQLNFAVDGSQSKPKDIYDFEESHDSVENAIIPLVHTRPNKIESSLASNKPDEKDKENNSKKVCDDPEDESSYSDRDDFYNFNSISGSGTEEDQEETIETEASEDGNSQSKKSSKTTTANSQKKCLIMGRIFKNAKKNSEPIIENKEKELVKPIPKQQLDEIFDNLRSKTNKANAIEAETLKIKSTTNKLKENDNNSTTPNSDNEQQNDENPKSKRVSAKSRKSREVANLEAELGMSMEQIKDLIGIGKRKTQRRCATNRQHKFVETWSSDEYEEFHSPKDIIALIQEAEMKAQRTKAKSTKQTTEPNAIQIDSVQATEIISTKSNPIKKSNELKSDRNKENNRKIKSKIEDSAQKVGKIVDNNKNKTKKATFSGVKSEDSDFDEHWNKTAKRAKIRNRRRTIASREDVFTEDQPKTKARTKPKESNVKVAEAKKIPTTSIPTSTSDIIDKKKDIKPTITNSTTTGNASTKSKSSKPMPRRKRIASEMLYYWSSSSDEEFGRIEPSENDDEDNNDNHLEQHGWIVGDSHKKLVTLLAHAKGKKIEDCAVKEAAHKKK